MQIFRQNQVGVVYSEAETNEKNRKIKKFTSRFDPFLRIVSHYSFSHFSGKVAGEFTNIRIAKLEKKFSFRCNSVSSTKFTI